MVKNVLFLLILFFVFTARDAAANSVGLPVPSGDPQPQDLDEMDDIAGERDYLPPDYGVAPVNRKKLKKVESDMESLLKKSATDLRANKTAIISLAQGTSSPWQGTSLGFQGILSPLNSVGLTLGTGKFEQEGEVAERSYDLNVKSRAVALGYQRYFETYEPFGVQFFLGYALWEGNVIPSGSDSLSTGNDRLSSSFEANGWFVGVNVSMSWIWESGIFLEWIPFGLQSSSVLQFKKSTDSTGVDDAVIPSIESPAFFGISNIKIGYLL